MTKGLAAYAHQNPGLHLENAAEYYRQANQLIVQMKLNMDPNLRLTNQIDPLAMPGKSFILNQSSDFWIQK